MRKIVLAAAIAGTALTLNACSDGADDAAVEADATADASGQSDPGTTAEAGTRLDANTATAAELAGAAGVSPELAEAIGWGLGRELFSGMRQIVTSAEEGACTWQMS